MVLEAIVSSETEALTNPLVVEATEASEAEALTAVGASEKRREFEKEFPAAVHDDDAVMVANDAVVVADAEIVVDDDFFLAHLPLVGNSEVETPRTWRTGIVRRELRSVATEDGEDDRMYSRCLIRCA